MKSKKGVISVQFNWVFILIAGALILLFFGSLVLKGKEVSDLAIAETILTNMQTIMTGAEVSVRTINPIKIPDKEIKVSCNSISVGKVSKPITKNKIIFSPTTIKGRTLLTLALDWNSPYHVTNFLYLTTPNIKYVFVKPTGNYAKGLYDLLPNEINKMAIDDLSEIRYTGNYFKFVFFNTPHPEVPSALISVPDKDVSAINVDTSSNKITFYKKNGNIFDSVSGDSTYLGKPMLLGAVFSQDRDDYNCNLKKAFNKLNIVSQVYKKRTEVLAESGCAPYYDTMPFLDIIESSRGNNIDISGIKGGIEEIENYNKHLQSRSCPTLY